jgi:tRNA(Arg) A34 adenosine deaminase TadA
MNKLLAPGVNFVLAPGYSFAHVKMVAILVAHQLGGDFDLGGEGQPPYELVASTEPCSMYFGAVPWFGVRHLVRGARGEDAEAAGFDKGPKPAEWVRMLEEPGITVERDVLRNEAAAVLRETAKKAARSTSTTAARVARAETPWGMLSGCGSHTLSPRRGPRCGRRLPLVRRGRALQSPRPPGPAPRRP